MTAPGTLRQALRELRRSPAYVLTVVATLAVGAGLTAAVFTVVDAVLLRPLGYRDADRIVALESHFTVENRSINKIGGDDYNDVARDVRGLEVTAYYNAYPDAVGANGSAVFLPIAYASPRFGEVLGVRPVAGRLFHSGSDTENEVLTSFRFAGDHFGSAQAALGHTLEFEGRPRVIVGVLPSGFDFPQGTGLWFEGPVHPDIGSRSAFNQRAIGRRKANVAPQQLADELAVYSRHLQQSFPEDRNKVIEAVPLRDELVGGVRPTLRLLMAAVTVVLLIVAVNLTHLQLVRGAQQLGGNAVRTALGASRASLIWRTVAESCLLALASGLVALLLASVTLRLVLRLAPADLPRLADIRVHGEVLLFLFSVSLLVMLGAAVLPVCRFFHLSPASVLRRNPARSTPDRAKSRLGSGLIVIEVALTLMLSVGAILLTRQLLAASRVALGFSPQQFAVLDMHATDRDLHSEEQPPAADASAAQRKAVLTAGQARALQRLDGVVDLVAATPGVREAGAIVGAPGDFGTADVRYTVGGAPLTDGGDTLPDADVHPVTPGFFAALNVPLEQGRLFTADDRVDAPLVVVVNEALVRQSFAGKSPLGQQIRCGLDDPGMRPWTIVGVVADIHHGSPAEPAAPAFYVPFAQHPFAAGDAQIVARTATDPGLLLDTLRRRVQQAHPEIAVKASTMQAAIGRTEENERFRTALLGSFAAVSLLLAAIGIYGVTAYSVAQRRFEFGLRVAVGAARAQVLGLVLRRALTMAALGIAGGGLLSLALTRVLARVAGRLPAFDLPTYLWAAAAVVVLAVGASVVPAASAAAVEPMQVLRNE